MSGELAGIGDALEGLVAHLRTADLSASVDPTEVNLPGVWVSLGLISPDLLDGNGHLEAVMYAAVPDAAFPDAIRMLDELLGQVLALVDVTGDIVLQPLTMPDGSTVPAVRLTHVTTYQRTDDD